MLAELPEYTTMTERFDPDRLRAVYQQSEDFLLIDHNPDESVICLSSFEVESQLGYVPPITDINDELGSSKAAMDRYGVTQYRAGNSSLDSYFYFLQGVETD